ncbi:D-alanine--D-alanine ligase family protein [Aquipuribacter sp. SD81]|uniref:D-alanine--D-alanine ligase family protein n=1 Tax=Aquipuribacter sp. SD81 TaxID=3127703 RepID=UPI00301AE93D
MSSPAGGARRPRVAVLFGGRSGEHGISCVTASGVLAALDRERYDVVAVGITRSGAWLLVDDDPAVWRLRGRDLPEVTDASAVQPGHVLPATDSAAPGLVRVPADGAPVPVGDVDVVLPLLHGPYGEDGTVQGLLELAGTRYVGSGVLASAACMDKHTMKVLLAHAGFAVADWVLLQPSDWRGEDGPAATARRVKELGSAPVFVKPSRAGSSLGITRVDDPADTEALLAALDTAAEHDPRVLVEVGVSGREVECGVLGGADGATPTASVCGEIVVHGDGFYDFEAKYLDGSAVDLVAPADLPDDVAAHVRERSVAAFAALGCEGLARVDWFVEPGGDPDAPGGARLVLNELNTMPGFTATSMYPVLWDSTGVDYPELVDRLLRLALSRPTGLR